jgi:hypothetical protein
VAQHVVNRTLVLDTEHALVVIRSDGGRIVGLARTIHEAEAKVHERNEATGQAHEWAHYPASISYRPSLDALLEV